VVKLPKHAYKSLDFMKQWIKLARKDGAKKEAAVEKLVTGMERW
jgi:hypothetical protein